MELLRYLERDAKARGNVIVEYLAIIDYIEFTATGVASVSYRQNAKRRTATGTIFADCSGMGVVLSKRAIVPLRPTLAVGIEYLVPLKREPHTIDLFVDSELKGGYGWIFPLNSKTAIVGFGTLCEDSFKDIESSLQKMWQIPRVSERCALKPSRRDISVLRTGKPLKRFSAGNVVVIGDAAIQANPLAGEGIRFVMDAARTAAKSIRAALRTHDLGKLQEYDHAWSKKYRRKYLLAERLQRAIKRWSNDDKKLDAGVRVLARLPDETFARLLSGDINYLLLAKIAAVALVSRNK
jgi:digeranylgeranylglycerophospholipid reductase